LASAGLAQKWPETIQQVQDFPRTASAGPKFRLRAQLRGRGSDSAIRLETAFFSD
jgi:hypothetical protein